MDIEKSPISVEMTMDQIERAIITGTRRGWIMKRIGLGHIEAKLAVRSHLAIVDIYYDKSTFSIRYKESRNLNYKAGSVCGDQKPSETQSSPPPKTGFLSRIGLRSKSKNSCGTATIHRNYNRWIRNLEVDLNGSFSRQAYSN